jgi:hypothetical protein
VIKTNGVRPGSRAVGIVEQLVEPGNLRRLECLIADQRGLDHPEYRAPQDEVVRNAPLHAELGVDLLDFQIVLFVVVIADAQSPGDGIGKVKVAVHVTPGLGDLLLGMLVEGRDTTFLQVALDISIEIVVAKACRHVQTVPPIKILALNLITLVVEGKLERKHILLTVGVLLFEVALDQGEQDVRAGEWRIPQAPTVGVRVDFGFEIGGEETGIEVECEIAKVGMAPAELDLGVELGGDRRLEKDVLNVLIALVVGPPAIAGVAERPGIVVPAVSALRE